MLQPVAKRVIKNMFNLKDGRASYAQIRLRVLSGMRINAMHICVLIVAMIIACVGLNINSAEAIVGSMLICPLMGSVVAIAYSIASGDFSVFRAALVGLLGQIVVCLITSTLYFKITPLSHMTSELLSNTSPTAWDVIIALAGGFAGGIGITRKQEPATIIAGVAVATALMPPLCASGYGIAIGSITKFAGAFYKFLLNVVFIAFAAEIVLVAIRVPLKRDLNHDGVVTEEEKAAALARTQKVRRLIVLGTIVFFIPCLFITHDIIQQTRLLEQQMTANSSKNDAYKVAETTEILRTVCPEVIDYHVDAQGQYLAQEHTTHAQIAATITTTKEISREKQVELEKIVRLHIPDINSVLFVIQRT